jgi:protein TonB
MTMACAGDRSEASRPDLSRRSGAPTGGGAAGRYDSRRLLSTSLSLAGHVVVFSLFVVNASRSLAPPHSGERLLEVQIVAGAQESVASQARASAGDEAAQEAEPLIEAPEETPLPPSPPLVAAPEAIVAPLRPPKPSPHVERRERPEPARAPRGAPRENQEKAAAEGVGRERLQNVASARGGRAGPSSSAGAAQTASYRALALAHLARFKRYPNDARDRNVVGVAVVRFTLSPHGEVVAVALARSSGAASLDEATLAMVRRASPFPPMTDGASGMSITAGVDYNLR